MQSYYSGFNVNTRIQTCCKEEGKYLEGIISNILLEEKTRVQKRGE
jgi:hypothetical protein